MTTWHLVAPEYPPGCGGVGDYTALLAAGSIAFLSIAEKHYKNLLALIPVLPLLAWFFAQKGATTTEALIFKP